MNSSSNSEVNIQTERLVHIEFRAYFFGKVSRKDLQHRFGIKEAAATRDFNKYNELAPKNLIYSPKFKAYVISDAFFPAFKYSTPRVLSTLAEGFGDALEQQESDLLCESPTLINPPKLSTISILSRAIVNSQVLNIGYNSLSSGSTNRDILPFALVDNGLRWHIRAWDRRRERFTDFVVTRIEKPKVVAQEQPMPHELPDKDVQWNKKLVLELIPHPRIKHSATIEKDYGMRNGQKRISIRAAVAGYMLRRWNVDCSKGYILRSEEYQLALKNLDAIDESIDNMSLAPGFKFE